MPPRRGGTKSRNGCDRCKHRRVKCDETAPCSNRIRREEHCSLVDTAHPAQPSSNFCDRPTFNTSTPTSASDSGAASWAFDLYLMSHFSTETVYTFSSYPSLVNAWQTTIVSDAASHPFLLHGILAVSALHLASKCGYPSENGHQSFTRHDYMRAFRYHQDQAMPIYRSNLQALDSIRNEEFAVRAKQPWPAGPVYAMAVLTAFISTANISDNSPSLDPDQQSRREDDHSFSPAPPSTLSSGSTEAARAETVFGHLMEIFTVTRGTRVIVKAGLDTGTFQTTAYRHLINASTTTNQFPLWSTSAEISEWYNTLRIQCLEDLMEGAPASKPEREICASAITCLEEVHDGAARLLEFKKERLWHLQKNNALRYDFVWLLKWTAVVSQEFLALIHERHQAAMVVLAQFVTICDLFEYQWYLKNWVRNAMAAIRHMLGSSKANEWVDKIAERWLSPERAMVSP